MDIIEKIEELKLVPVIVVENPQNILTLGKILMKAGLPIAEITFRTKAAAEALSVLKKKFSNMLVGAGTILKIDQVKAAVNSDADFIITPGFNPKIVDYCLENKILIIPGVNTPTMVEWALDRGITVLKFFPANLSGGTEMLKSLAGPYPEVRFIPTGGINSENLIEYLKLNNVIACGGSWIVKKELISSGNFEEIKILTENVMSMIRSEFR